jgi:hypothetical protein
MNDSPSRPSHRRDQETFEDEEEEDSEGKRWRTHLIEWVQISRIMLDGDERLQMNLDLRSRPLVSSHRSYPIEARLSSTLSGTSLDYESELTTATYFVSQMRVGGK